MAEEVDRTISLSFFTSTEASLVFFLLALTPAPASTSVQLGLRSYSPGGIA
jgi:hypothetical protein